MFRRKPVKILKHHRASSVYIDGRYLVVESRMSLRSKRGREIAHETAQAIHAAVYDATPGPEIGVDLSVPASVTDLGAQVRDHEGRD